MGGQKALGQNALALGSVRGPELYTCMQMAPRFPNQTVTYCC